MGRGKKQLVSFVWNVGLRDRRALGNRVKMSSGRHVVTLKGWLRNLSSFAMQKKPLKHLDLRIATLQLGIRKRTVSIENQQRQAASGWSETLAMNC